MTAPVNPDGSLNLSNLGDPNSQPAGELTIWNLILPKDLQNIGNEIWYGTENSGSIAAKVPEHSVKILRMPGEDQGATGGPGVIETPGNAAVLAGASTPNGQDTANQQTVNIKAGTANTQVTHDIFTSPQAILAQIASLSDPRNVGNLQQFLAIQKALASGPWGSVNVNGVFDKNTQDAVINAMKDWYLISHGGKLGISFMDYLLGSGQVSQALGGGGTPAGSGLASGSTSGRSTLDPSVIRMAAQTAAQNALGEGLSEKQLDQFVSQFQSQTAGQDTYTSSLHLPDIAMGFVQKNDAGAYKAQQRQSYIDTLVNMFAPSGSQRPNETPVPSIT